MMDSILSLLVMRIPWDTKIRVVSIILDPRRIADVEQAFRRIVRVVLGPAEQTPAIGERDDHVPSLVDENIEPGVDSCGAGGDAELPQDLHVGVVRNGVPEHECEPYRESHRVEEELRRHGGPIDSSTGHLQLYGAATERSEDRIDQEAEDERLDDTAGAVLRSAHDDRVQNRRRQESRHSAGGKRPASRWSGSRHSRRGAVRMTRRAVIIARTSTHRVVAPSLYCRRIAVSARAGRLQKYQVSER